MRLSEKGFHHACLHVISKTESENRKIMKRNAIISIAFLAAVLLSCSGKKTEKPTESIDTIPVMVMQIQKCSKLYATEYHVHKIITHDDQLKLKGSFLKHDYDIGLPLGKRKVAIPIDATIKAYIDFSEFSEQNVRKSGKKIEIILPDPRITLTSTRINHNEIRQYVAMTRRNFSDAELASYENLGRKSIIADIPNMDIIERARLSAANVLVPLIEQMGYKQEDITITFNRPFSATDIMNIIDKSTIENGKEQ